ncbi:hypothetical protein [uncultured Acinetobacter sp.]|uniref:hypothetical protein n=1 Tax=uncultured Acinetobacter sp. TaxID=165433 RepID=UPI00260B4221|nr:hypothetical protein [uncultured Acinetobacter sp.]
MNIRSLDGFNLDVPPTHAQVVALARQHRHNLDDAIFHEDIHLGNFCLAQRKRVYDFTRELSPEQRLEFYTLYNGELERIADEDQLHPADAEGGVSVFAIAIVLAIIALILYFGVVRNMVG